MSKIAVSKKSATAPAAPAKNVPAKPAGIAKAAKAAKPAAEEKPANVVAFPKGKAANTEAAPKAEKVAKTSAKAEKPAAAEKAPKAAGVRKDASSTIKILVKENPYREGSKAAAAFELAKSTPNLGEFRAALKANVESYEQGFIYFAKQSGYISVG